MYFIKKFFGFNKTKSNENLQDISAKLLDTENQLKTYINKYLKNEEKWQIINKIFQEVNSTIEIYSILESISSQIIKLVEAKAYSLYYFDNKNQKLVHKFSSNNNPPEINAYMETIIEKKNDEYQIFEDILKDINSEQTKNALNKNLEKNYYIIPIINYDQFLGIMLLYKFPDFLSTEEINILEIIAKNIAITIRNAELYQTLKKYNKNQIQFIANLAHEFKTPLSSIIGFAKIILSKDKIAKNQLSKFTTNILTSGRHLLKLIEDIQDASIAESGNLSLHHEVFNPKITISEIILQCEYVTEECNIKIVPRLIDCNITADIRRFRQVIYNLLSNAIKFSNPDSVVSIISYLENDHFCFEINNKGKIIKKEDKNKVFELFYQGTTPNLDQNYKGAGLGLSLCKKIVELHNGSIDYSSGEKEGTTFVFAIPLSPKQIEIQK